MIPPIERCTIEDPAHQSYMGSPRYIRRTTPWGPLCQAEASVTYGVAKELGRILKSLTGRTILHVNNTKELADKIKNTRLEEEEYITSYVVSSLFTSIPVTSSIDIIRNNLVQDTELPNRTTMSSNSIIELLGFCLFNTYFLFQGQFFEQTKGAAMGWPVSPIIANLYMEAFEHRAIPHNC